MKHNDSNRKINALFVCDAAGILEPATANQIIEHAIQLLGKRLKRNTSLESPQLAREYLQLKLAALEHEVFVILFLDTKHRLLACEEIFRGTIDACTVHPREVLKIALARNAAAVILAHNHPSGIAEPSQADRRLTDRLREVLALVDIRVIDHLVVGADTAVSFAERGLL